MTRVRRKKRPSPPPQLEIVDGVLQLPSAKDLFAQPSDTQYKDLNTAALLAMAHPAEVEKAFPGQNPKDWETLVDFDAFEGVSFSLNAQEVAKRLRHKSAPYIAWTMDKDLCRERVVQVWHEFAHQLDLRVRNTRYVGTGAVDLGRHLRQTAQEARLVHLYTPDWIPSLRSSLTAMRDLQRMSLDPVGMQRELDQNFLFPKKLPFASTAYVMYPPLEVRAPQKKALISSIVSHAVDLGDHAIESVSASILGWLISEDGFCWELNSIIEGGSGLARQDVRPKQLYTLSPIRLPRGMDMLHGAGAKGWQVGSLLGPAMIGNITEVLADKVSCTLTSDPSMRSHLRKLCSPKKARRKRVPEAYYVVPIEEKFTERRTGMPQGLSNRQAPGYQFDVRGHERLSLKKGQLPLSEEKYEKLVALGYQVFHYRDPTQEEFWEFERRGIPPQRADQWMAGKVSYVKAHKRGPEEAPYVPALRTLRR